MKNIEIKTLERAQEKFKEVNKEIAKSKNVVFLDIKKEHTKIVFADDKKTILSVNGWPVTNQEGAINILGKRNYNKAVKELAED